jgi:hypothetical protein
LSGVRPRNEPPIAEGTPDPYVPKHASGQEPAVGVKKIGALPTEMNRSANAGSESARVSFSKRDYIRYLDIISKAWGPLLVASCRAKHVIHLRDKWVSTPVAANMLVAVLRLLIAWGIPREFSESNPCIHVPRLETNTEGARPWPAWAYKLIDECGREDIKSAVLLARHTGQRQADVLRMAPEHIEDGGIVVVQHRRPARSCGCPCTPSEVRWKAGAAAPPMW